MAVTVTDLAVRASWEGSAAEQGIDRLNASVQKTPGFLSNAISTATGFMAATGIMNAVGGAFDFAKDSVIGFNSLMEQSTIGFTTMLGSGRKAERFLADLQAFAAKTPFRFEGLVQSSQRLLAMGFAADEIKPLLTSVGDAMAALGQGDAGIDRATYALGQMRSAGRVTAQDMMQLTSLGIPAWDILAQHAGKTVAEVRKMAEDGAIDAETAIFALTSGMTERFGGLMASQATTFGGAMSTILDTAQILIAGAFRPIFEEISGLMQGIAAWAQSPAAQALGEAIAGGVRVAFQAISGFASRIGPIFGKVLEVVGSPQVQSLIGAFGTVFSKAFNMALSVAKAAMPVLKAIGDVVLPAIGAAAAGALPLLEGFLDILGGVFDYVAEHGELVKGLLIGIAAALAGFATAKTIIAVTQIAQSIGTMFTTIVSGAPAAISTLYAIGTAVYAALGPVGLIIAGIVVVATALFLAWQTNFLGIRDILTNVWAVIQPIFEAIVSVIGTTIEAIVGFVSGAAELIGKVVTFFVEMPGKVVDALREFASKPGYYIGLAIGTVIGWFARGIRAAIDFGIEFVSRIVGFFQSLPGRVAEFVSNLFNTVIQWFGRTRDQATDAAGDLIRNVIEFFKTLPERALGAIRALPGLLLDFLRELPGRIAGAVSAIGRSIVTGIWSGISGMAGWLGDQVSGFVDGIVDGIGDALGIGSPSKVMAEIGGFMTLGLAQGILREGDAATSAMQSVLDDASGQLEAGALGVTAPPLLAGAGAGAGIVVNIYVERFTGRQEEADYYAGRVAESLRITRET